jgi:hypothetical protein
VPDYAKLHLTVSGGETEWCLRKTRIGKKAKTKNGKKKNGNRGLKKFLFNNFFFTVLPCKFLKRGEEGYLRLFFTAAVAMASAIAVAAIPATT